MYKCCFLACFCASQRVQLRKTELTLTLIRERQPNGWADWHQIWHTCANNIDMGMDIRQTYCPSTHKGGTWFFLGGQQCKSVGKLSDWHQRWFTSADSSGNRHMSANNTPRWHSGGEGVVCIKVKGMGKLANGWNDWPQIWHTCSDSSGNGYTPNKLPLDTQGGHLGGFMGLGKLSNGVTDWHQLWFTSADSSGNGHKLNPSRPSIPRGHFWEGG